MELSIYVGYVDGLLLVLVTVNTHLAERPSTLNVCQLHLNRARNNSPKGPTYLMECLMNYDTETESPGYILDPVECPLTSAECSLNY